ncbi:MAG: bifunctional oligoribonuclease/PAP phosphatase NrnA [Gracilimonas sp.]|uniref:DHH family phosphoesterase n=1 Tax=Gracilimonas TaxID=649462 RepID=UPI001B2C607D|nr:bifunctional oligoribonuclease/PAP phosphatase NrnA [Gracilimonas sp.]MBO6584684.1 bifunctional oligoribonuclease/PAP phosphatase NrnA [Gracilimonas sp.]MBO6616045.1 bifunctional oligoribonuclease/PAP phosphatase NrnA [Gracilimonas sp.]
MFKNFISKIVQHQKVAVFSHVRPDGDCLGSQVALCLWLQKNGIETSAFNEDSIPENMAWLLDFFPISKPTEAELSDFDAFIVVDGNALHRFGGTAEKISELSKPVYMIDHHPDPDDIFEEFVSEVEASSTCELVYRLYAEHDPQQIDEHAAKAMYLGLVTDTGSFQFDSVKPGTLHAAADLLDRGGFTPNQITEKIYSSRPLRQLKLLSLALDTIELHAGGKISTITITRDMFEQTGTSNEDTEGFVQYPLSVEGVKACVLFREDGDRVKLSLRSQSDIDVNKWARKFNGGGHKKAAGAWHSGPLQAAVDEVINAGKEQL